MVVRGLPRATSATCARPRAACAGSRPGARGASSRSCSAAAGPRPCRRSPSAPAARSSASAARSPCRRSPCTRATCRRSRRRSRCRSRPSPRSRPQRGQRAGGHAGSGRCRRRSPSPTTVVARVARSPKTAPGRARSAQSKPGAARVGRARRALTRGEYRRDQQGHARVLPHEPEQGRAQGDVRAAARVPASQRPGSPERAARADRSCRSAPSAQKFTPPPRQGHHADARRLPDRDADADARAAAADADGRAGPTPTADAGDHGARSTTPVPTATAAPVDDPGRHADAPSRAVLAQRRRRIGRWGPAAAMHSRGSPQRRRHRPRLVRGLGRRDPRRDRRRLHLQRQRRARLRRRGLRARAPRQRRRARGAARAASRRSPSARSRRGSGRRSRAPSRWSPACARPDFMTAVTFAPLPQLGNSTSTCLPLRAGHAPLGLDVGGLERVRRADLDPAARRGALHAQGLERARVRAVRIGLRVARSRRAAPRAAAAASSSRRRQRALRGVGDRPPPSRTTTPNDAGGRPPTPPATSWSRSNSRASSIPPYGNAPRVTATIAVLYAGVVTARRPTSGS